LRRIVYGSIVLLAILHQDAWWWNSIDPLLFGFIPIGLAWHAFVSIAAGILWAMAVKYCWPEDVDVMENAATASGGCEPGRPE